MNIAFPDSNINDFSSLIDSIFIPDKNDRHVVATAIKSNADKIVTFNLKHFPSPELLKYNLEAQHPDEFLNNLYLMNPGLAIEAFEKLVTRLRNPVKKKSDIINMLKKLRLTKISKKLENSF